jgi:2-amino-4-hydroxy-6-hydroxymethyldihydropteridine diphosphokinase
MNGVYIIIGGNMGDRALLIRKCKELIANTIAPILKESDIYETAAWGKTNVPSYLNQVLYLEVKESPNVLLQKCLAIEHQLGRIRQEKWDSRLIDIDLLFYNHEIIHESNLSIPHPHMHKRRFVLVPLAEIAPTFIHPIIKNTIQELLLECEDKLEVIPFDPN